jgi:hypothetical protein
MTGDTCDNESGNEDCEPHVYFDAVTGASVSAPALSASFEPQNTDREPPLVERELFAGASTQPKARATRSET